jgi:hypothetical protein
MALFSNHKVTLGELLKFIPEEEFCRIAQSTGVDYYSKVLSGKVLFYLLLYSLLMDDNLGQRGIADLYASSAFKNLFNLHLTKSKIAHSSLSERLSKVDVDFFKQLYGCIYQRYSALYPAGKESGFRLQRVDSSLVVEASNKLKEGMTCGNEYKTKKMLKYTINYDGMYGSCAATHTEEKYASESLALPENVIVHFKKSADHADVYVFDRGQSSTESFREMKSHKGLLFVGRLLENRKLHIVRDFDLTFRHFQWGRYCFDNKPAPSSSRCDSRDVPSPVGY